MNKYETSGYNTLKTHISKHQSEESDIIQKLYNLFNRIVVSKQENYEKLDAHYKIIVDQKTNEIGHLSQT